jgi:hypothetical protein
MEELRKFQAMLVSIVVVDGKPMERKMLVCFLLF